MTARLFWGILTVACVVWYTTITVYVAIRGAYDIKHMLRSLASGADDEQKESDGR